MDHEKDGRLFEKYMNGELDPAAEAQFEEYVATCPKCAVQYADLIKIKRGLSFMNDEPLPDGFKDEWKARVYAYSPSSLRNTARKFNRRIFPAIAAGVAVVAVISALVMSGVLFPSLSMQEVQTDASVEAQLFAERNVQDGAWQDDAVAGESATDAEDASLYTTKEASEAGNSVENKMSGEGGDRAAIALYVTPEIFDALTKLLLDKDAEFCLDEGLLIVSVTEENQESLVKFSEKYALNITPVLGEVYEVWVEE